MTEKRGSGGPFLLGFLLGIFVALLFTTKKGRKILSALTEEGMNSLEDLLEPNTEDLEEDVMEEVVNDEEMPEKKESNGRKRIFRNLRKN